MEKIDRIAVGCKVCKRRKTFFNGTGLSLEDTPIGTLFNENLDHQGGCTATLRDMATKTFYKNAA